MPVVFHPNLLFSDANATSLGLKSIGQDLQSHIARQFLIAHTIHLSYASRTDERKDFVRGQVSHPLPTS